jgi:hypothetical protein
VWLGVHPEGGEREPASAHLRLPTLLRVCGVPRQTGVYVSARHLAKLLHQVRVSSCPFCLFDCDRVALHLPGQTVASLETLSLTESFLGLASALFRFGRLAMLKLPGSLRHVTQVSA